MNAYSSKLRLACRAGQALSGLLCFYAAGYAIFLVVLLLGFAPFGYVPWFAKMLGLLVITLVPVVSFGFFGNLLKDSQLLSRRGHTIDGLVSFTGQIIIFVTMTFLAFSANQNGTIFDTFVLYGIPAIASALTALSVLGANLLANPRCQHVLP